MAGSCGSRARRAPGRRHVGDWEAFLDELLENAERLAVEPHRLVLIDTRVPMTQTETLIHRLDELARFGAAQGARRRPDLIDNRLMLLVRLVRRPAT